MLALALPQCLTDAVADALIIPPSTTPLDYFRSCTRAAIASQLKAAELGGLTDRVWAGVQALRSAKAATG